MIEPLLGLTPAAVPPHVFAMDVRALRYGSFGATVGAIELREYQRQELPAETFNEGPLGGSLREASAFKDLLRRLLDRISAPVREASLVLPDNWLRVSFTEVGELPRKAAARDEVLRWKLRRLVPYRVEDLRLTAREVAPLAGQEEPRRVMLGFAAEQLLAQIESAFAEHGVRLGQISNESLSLLPGLRAVLDPAEWAAVVRVAESAYAVVVTRRGEPAIHRYKRLDGGMPASARERIVLQDMRLTRRFLEEQAEAGGLRRIVLVSPDDSDEVWRDWLEEAFEAPVSSILDGWAFHGQHAPGVTVDEIAPMFGAACREVK